MRGRKPRQLNISPDDIPRLKRIARNIDLPWSHVRLARVVLSIAAGDRVQNIASQIQCDPATVWRIARAWDQHGMTAFDKESRGYRTMQDEQLDAIGTTDESLIDSSLEPLYRDEEPMPGLGYLASRRQSRAVLMHGEAREC